MKAFSAASRSHSTLYRPSSDDVARLAGVGMATAEDIDVADDAELSAKPARLCFALQHRVCGVGLEAFATGATAGRTAEPVGLGVDAVAGGDTYFGRREERHRLGFALQRTLVSRSIVGHFGTVTQETPLVPSWGTPKADVKRPSDSRQV